jgi:hypothetical protein
MSKGAQNAGPLNRDEGLDLSRATPARVPRVAKAGDPLLQEFVRLGTALTAESPAQIAGSGALGPRELALFCAVLDPTRQALIRRSDRVSRHPTESHACVSCRCTLSRSSSYA